MTNSKKKRMSMLDSLAAAGAPSPTPQAGTASSMMSTNRALRSARDAVDGHHVWELDPWSITDDRVVDRIDPSDIVDLRDAIETNGQTVPILVRRAPNDPDKYLLVYGRRRLEAIRTSEKVTKIRALVATLDDDSALRAQISENMARRDLSFIEKALFARELVESGFGTQAQVAEVLTVTKSAISMALAIVDAVGVDLVRAIGPAHGVGRPRWETLGRMMTDAALDKTWLCGVADAAHRDGTAAMLSEDGSGIQDVSVHAFDTVFAAATQAGPQRPAARTGSAGAKSAKTALKIDGKSGGSIRRGANGDLTLQLSQGPFADWLETEAQTLINELHTRWQQRGED